MVGEQLVLVIHMEPGRTFTEELRQEIARRNSKLINYKRIHGIVVYNEEFPLTASLKIIRVSLAERLAKLDRDQAVLPV
jgi:acyl-coenzyme A synthetase/AMP-(fatty) acid ligase